MDGVGGGVQGREEEGPGRDTQPSGSIAWWVAGPLPEVGRHADRRAGVGTQFGTCWA